MRDAGKPFPRCPWRVDCSECGHSGDDHQKSIVEGQRSRCGVIGCECKRYRVLRLKRLLADEDAA